MADESNRNQSITGAAALSILSGAWLLVGPTWMSGMHWDGMHEGMMYSVRPLVWHHSFMGDYLPVMGWPFPGVLMGLLTLICGVLIYAVPTQRLLWGVLILVSSLVVLTMSMGGLVPGVLGIVGAVLALMPGGDSSQRGGGHA